MFASKLSCVCVLIPFFSRTDETKTREREEIHLSLFSTLFFFFSSPFSKCISIYLSVSSQHEGSSSSSSMAVVMQDLRVRVVRICLHDLLLACPACWWYYYYCDYYYHGGISSTHPVRTNLSKLTSTDMTTLLLLAD